MDRVERGGRRDVKMRTTFSWLLSREQTQARRVTPENRDQIIVSFRSSPVRRFLNAYNYPGTKHVRP